MSVINMVDNMSTDTYLRLKHAAETGRWPEGTVVDKPTRDSALQLIMAYQARHLSSDEMLTIGEDGQIVNKTKRELKEQFKGENQTPETKKCDKNDIARFTKL